MYRYTFRDIPKIYNRQYQEKIAKFTKIESLYNNLEKQRYLKNTLILGTGTFGLGIGATVASKKWFSEKYNQPQALEKPVDRALWYGVGMLALQGIAAGPQFGRTNRAKLYWDRFILCRPSLDRNIKNVRPHFLNQFAGYSLQYHFDFLSFTRFFARQFFVFGTGLALANMDLNPAQLGVTYTTTAACASLAVCSLACLRRKDITKFIYNFGLFPGLYGCLGFLLYKQNDQQFIKNGEQYKVLGVPTNISDEWLKFNRNDVKYVVTAALITSLLVDIALLRIWQAGKLSGAPIAFLVGALQAQIYETDFL